MRLHALALAALLASTVLAAAQEAFTFKAADGVVVHAERYGAGGRRGIVLAFHMAGSNKSEYAAIAPRLVKDGFEVIAIDQRSGGALWGRQNETARGFGHKASYAAALPDLEAALQFAKQKSGERPVIALGSSYSASLALVLASKHPEIAAVAAFSPGEYFGELSVKAAAAKVAAPIFVTSASDNGEIAEAKALLDVAPARVKQQFVPRAGVHGASTLRADENPRGAEAAWAAFEDFLDKAAPAKGS